MVPWSLSVGSLQVVTGSPRRAMALSSANTVELPSETLPSFDGALANEPTGATCAGWFWAVLPFTAAGSSSMNTDDDRSLESCPLKGRGIGVSTGPAGLGTSTK